MNHSHMSVQMTLLLERGRTFSALIRALVSVFHALVLCQTIAKRKRSVTLIAEEVSFLAVNASDVLVKISSLHGDAKR